MLDDALWQQLPLFMLAALVLNATPGVDLLLTVTRTAQSGPRAGRAAAVGIAAGCALHVLAAAFGLAALLALSEYGFTIVKALGATYLLWLGLGMLRSAWRGGPALQLQARPAAVVGVAADMRRGLLTNLMNPKVALFMLAFVPQFIPPHATHKTLVFLTLGLLFVVQGLLFLLAVVALTQRVARWPALAGGARWFAAAGGLLFLALAARLAVARNELHV